MKETINVEMFSWTMFGLYVITNSWFTDWLDGELGDLNWFILDD